MREIEKIFIVLCVSAAAFANCANAQNVVNRNPAKVESSANLDLATDKAVIAELQKRVDTKSVELMKGDEKFDAKRKTASRLEAKDVCIERLKESAKVIVIGFFRTDVGCRFDGAFVDSRYFERGDNDLSRTVLMTLGWKKATRKEREKLARIWVEEGLLAFSEITHQVISSATMNSEIKITVFPKRPSGVTSRNAPKKFVFDADGNLNSAGDY